MSRATKRHASRRAERKSSEELVEDIRTMEEEIPNMPTHEFDDKRAIHKKRTRINVYKEELEEREDALVLGDFVITAKEAAERIAPYGDISNGIRSSKPSDNGLIQYLWRNARFHTGADMHMPVTDNGWLKDFLEDEGVIHEYISLTEDFDEDERREIMSERREKTKEVRDELEDFLTVIIRDVFEMDDTVAARRWKKAGLF